jgi:hypothetical protein
VTNNTRGGSLRQSLVASVVTTCMTTGVHAATGQAVYTIPVGPGNLALNARVDWVDQVQADFYNESQLIIPAHEDVALSASCGWKDYKLTVFGKNVTNGRHEVPTFIAPLFAAGSIGPGASWGAELQAKF